MNSIVIKQLTAELNQDEESIQQMVSEFQQFGVKETVRKCAVLMLQKNMIHGYLAYDGETSIGWCNAADMESYVGFVPEFARRNEFDYQGPVRLYEKAGFVEALRENGQVAMRKVL